MTMGAYSLIVIKVWRDESVIPMIDGISLSSISVIMVPKTLHPDIDTVSSLPAQSGGSYRRNIGWMTCAINYLNSNCVAV